jgi:hypothetical protein
VAANATTIVSANISYQAVVAGLIPKTNSHAEWNFNRSAIGDGTTNLFSTVADPTNTNDSTFATIPGGTGNTVTVTTSGVYAISVYAQVSAAPTGVFAINIIAAGANIGESYAPSGTNLLSCAVANIRLAAGTVLAFVVTKTTGSNADISSKIRITKLSNF